MSIIDQTVITLTDRQKVARLEQSISGLIGTILQLFDATCDACPDCAGCGNAHQIAEAALAHFGIVPAQVPKIETLDS